MIEIPSNTFFDDDVLTFSTHALGNYSNIFTVSGQRLEGVPLKAGTFAYRVDARDTLNQVRIKSQNESRKRRFVLLRSSLMHDAYRCSEGIGAVHA